MRIGGSRLAIVLGTVIALTGIALAAMTRSTTPPTDRSEAVTARPKPESPGRDRVVPAEVAMAMKEMDLIRPAQQKLAEDFTLKKADGGMFQLSEHRGKVVFINFWATWCPPCREEMPAMERLFQRSQKDSLVMLAVSVDADPTVVAQFLKEQRFTFTIGLDPKMKLADIYGVRALPASFIVDRQGHLAALALGPRTWDNRAAQMLVERMSR
jgi:peroxiredoxin